MGLVDILWMVLIIGGVVYLLYRSLWKKRGYCQGCSSGTCEVKKKWNSKKPGNDP
ncbi:hypothetical protein HKBW3S06_01226 [Candidatus Hakubella thermalkaliphila]|uniref:FeoB-associated Cys-rich membrane protein n=1 Tax=Candidatus Hakubella thermalkaliphila TaxID=2754717 RepID=A0A6V8NXK9_9ACTN|nr:FeoB-associated Cys-rich membrane protein [Candidatus Hakubella thermalkaliphila]GFP22000.1 hypothetical protein HKBW3S06_01226 [Candidatus Hakubella thermalkaliphila]GFP24989.1 hypothetical protein HKBW3S25_00427 [Candidatus Hakubella thermalkaliphila]GFP26678.1 hypothetical protein HKBW3S33_00093 [Candidatus Hakubella thermalkaliphila]